jgi:hypothetical protein
VPELAAVDGDGHGLAAVAVDDAGHLPFVAEPVRRPRAADPAGLDGKGDLRHGDALLRTAGT